MEKSICCILYICVVSLLRDLWPAGKWYVTFTAFARSLSRMGSLMLFKVQPLMKWLSAFFTFLNSLDSLMWFKTWVIGKRFVISLTFVRFFSHMDSEMDLKVWQYVIEVATFPTLWIIWCLHVTSKSLSFPLHLFPGWILRLWLMLEHKCFPQSLVCKVLLWCAHFYICFVLLIQHRHHCGY